MFTDDVKRPNAPWAIAGVLARGTTQETLKQRMRSQAGGRGPFSSCTSEVKSKLPVHRPSGTRLAQSPRQLNTACIHNHARSSKLLHGVLDNSTNRTTLNVFLNGHVHIHPAPTRIDRLAKMDVRRDARCPYARAPDSAVREFIVLISISQPDIEWSGPDLISVRRVSRMDRETHNLPCNLPGS